MNVLKISIFLWYDSVKHYLIIVMRAYVSMYSHDNFHAVESTEIEIPLHQFRAVISFFGLNMVRVSEHKFKLMTKHMFQFLSALEFIGIFSCLLCLFHS